MNHPYEDFNTAIDFALEQDMEAATFLRVWREGDCAAIDREWPEFASRVKPVADPWSFDLDAAPIDKDVLVWCEDTNQYFVAYRNSEKIIGLFLFCYAIHRGVYIMCKPTKWREIPE